MHRTPFLLAIVAVLLMPHASTAQDLPESSPQALLHHARGVDAYVKANHLEAIRHFEAAYEADPTFHVALLMAGFAASNAGLGARADSFYAIVAPHREKLSPYYRHRLEAQVAARAGDRRGLLESNRKAAAIGPGTKATYNVGYVLMQVGAAREARETLRRLDPDREPMKGWFAYYAVYTHAAHHLGDYEDELRMARKAREAHPGDIRAAELEASALVALGRTAQAERVLAEIRTMPRYNAITPGQIMMNVADELAAHGDAAAGKRWSAHALAWFEGLPPEEARITANRRDRAFALVRLGRDAEASTIFRELAAEFPNVGGWKAWQGVIAARMGDRAKAQEIARMVESGEIRIPNPENHTLWRSVLAAALEDRPKAVSLLGEWGLRPRWLHRDPILLPVLSSQPRWVAYLKPTG